MPNVEPPTDTVEAFEEKRALAASKSIVDWGHWVAGTKPSEIPRLAQAGAPGFKIFQVSGAYPHVPRLAINDEAALMASFRAIAATGLPCLVHPFNQSLFEHLSEEAWLEKGKAGRVFSEVYTTEAIWHTAVNTLINLQALTGVRLHLLHTHSAGSLRLIREAKTRGQRVSAEIDPKYYHLTPDDLDEQGGRVVPAGFVTADPDRMDEIWRSLRDGTIDNISIDHAPHTLEEVREADTDAWTSNLGCPQLDWLYPLVLTDVAAGHHSLARAVELLSEAPAKLAGVWPRKGALLPESDADLVLLDLNRQSTVTDDGNYTKVGWSPYAGRTLTGAVHLTMLRGRVIARERQILGEPGSGRYIAGTPQ
jgi:dihydroorotase